MSLFNESKWNDSEVEALIDLIRAHPVLWNSSNKDYKDPNARNAAFNVIAQKVNMPTDEVRKKYRNLRSQYVRELRLIRNRGFGTKWIFYSALRFLSTGQTSYKNDDIDALVSEDTQEYKEIRQVPMSTITEAHSTEEGEFEQLAADYIEDGVSNDEIDYPDDNEVDDTSMSSSPLAKRMRMQAVTNEKDFEIKQKRRPTLLVMKQPRKVRDEHEVLGEHVANELRALQNQPLLLKSLKCSILEAILEVNKALNS